MATAGQIVVTHAPDPVFVYRKLAASQTIAAGDPVGFDANGLVVKAVDTTDGPIMFATEAKTSGASDTVYIRLLKKGRIVTTAGGAIKPFKFVKVDSSSKIVVISKQSISGTYAQAEIQAVQNEVWRKAGVYVGKWGDNEVVLDAALNDLIVVEVDA